MTPKKAFIIHTSTVLSVISLFFAHIAWMTFKEDYGIFFIVVTMFFIILNGWLIYNQDV